MANWSNPTLTSLYTDFLAELKARDEDLAKQFDGQTVSNLVTGAIRWSSSANRWQKWSGSAWGELTTTYALTGLSTTGNASIGGTLSVTGTTALAAATATTPATGDNSTAVATTAYVRAQGYVSGASPALTGTPTAPTAALNTNTTQIATTAFVIGQGADTTPLMAGTAAVGTSLEFARGDHVHPTDTSRAPLASPTFTGTPAAPTAAVGTNTTQLATTAFVQAEIANDAPAKNGTGATGTWSIDISGNAATATKLATPRTINGVAFDGSADISITSGALTNPLTAGSFLTSTGTYDGSVARTFAVDATSAGTPGKVVARDLSGNFSAGTITANLTGTASGNLALTGGTLSGALLAAAGSISAPGVATSGDTNTGLWWESADRLVVVAGGARAAYFDAANQFNYGNIFITTADDAAADATTTTRTSGAAYLRGKYWNGTASVNTDWNTIYVPTDTAGNGEWRLRNGGTNRLVVNNSGTVTATLFSGSGASLTSLNASNLSSGTLPDARLSGTYTGVSIDGNAGTATTLQTARTINGTSFNGSANITTASWGTARTITLGGTSKSVDGSANVSWTAGEILTSPVSGNWFRGYLTAGADGVTEMGRYLDFHATNTATSDFDGRLECTGVGAFSFSGATVTAGTFSGSGASLTSLNASNLSSGTVPSARLTGSYGIDITGSSASCTGNAATVTNGVYTTGNQSIAGVKSFTGTLEAYDSSVDGTIVTATKFGRDSTQYVTFYGNASGNRLLAVSGLAAPKEFQIRVTDTSLTGAFIFARSGTLTATAFSGDGASLTSLNASNLGSGTVPSARLSGSYGIDITGNAATADLVSVIQDATTTGTFYVPIVNTNAAGDRQLRVNTAGLNALSFDKATSTLNCNIVGSCSGNAASVTNGVYTTGAQNIAGQKQFTDLIYTGSSSLASTTTTARWVHNTTGEAWFARSDSGANVVTVQRNNAGNTVRFIVGTTGVGQINCTTSATAYNTSSDYRLKENLTPLTGALDRLKLIPVHRFNFIIEPDRVVDGFLAHEVQEFVPEAVTGEKDAMEAIGTITDADGTVLEEEVPEPASLPDGQQWTETGERPDYQGIDQSKLVPLLTAAVQELLARIEALESA